MKLSIPWRMALSAGLCLFLLVVVGCAANTDQMSAVAPAVESQQAAQQPIKQTLVLTNHPEGKKIIADSEGYAEMQDGEGNQFASRSSMASFKTDDGNVFSLTNDGGGVEPVVSHSITNNYYQTIGNVTMTATGDQRGEQAGTATGTQTASATTDQKVDPNVTANMPVGIAAPGGVASPQATGTAGTSGDVNASQQVTADLQTQINDLKASNEAIMKILENLSLGIGRLNGEVDDIQNGNTDGG